MKQTHSSLTERYDSQLSLLLQLQYDRRGNSAFLCLKWEMDIIYHHQKLFKIHLVSANKQTNKRDSMNSMHNSDISNEISDHFYYYYFFSIPNTLVNCIHIISDPTDFISLSFILFNFFAHTKTFSFFFVSVIFLVTFSTVCEYE